MKRYLSTGLGLVFGIVALLGSAPQPALADAPSAGCPPTVKHHAVAHVRHHWRHRYVERTLYRAVSLPACGSVSHPCNVEHIVVRIQ